MSTSAVGIDVDDTDAIWTVFPNQAVWVWPVRDVLCHKRHGDHHFLYIVDGSLNLKVKRWNTVLLLLLLLHGFFAFLAQAPLLKVPMYGHLPMEKITGEHIYLCGLMVNPSVRAHAPRQGTFIFSCKDTFNLISHTTPQTIMGEAPLSWDSWCIPDTPTKLNKGAQINSYKWKTLNA